jgi:hypothetical protein
MRIFPGVWNIAAHVAVRVYMNIMGGPAMMMDDTWNTDGTDGDVAYILWFINDVQIFGNLRVEVQSDNAFDINVTLPYEYRVKDW